MNSLSLLNLSAILKFTRNLRSIWTHSVIQALDNSCIRQAIPLSLIEGLFLPTLATAALGTIVSEPTAILKEMLYWLFMFFKDCFEGVNLKVQNYPQSSKPGQVHLGLCRRQNGLDLWPGSNSQTPKTVGEWAFFSSRPKKDLKKDMIYNVSESGLRCTGTFAIAWGIAHVGKVDGFSFA